MPNMPCKYHTDRESYTWFPCSSVGTHMVCIPTLEHGNEKTYVEIKIEPFCAFCAFLRPICVLKIVNYFCAFMKDAHFYSHI